MERPEKIETFMYLMMKVARRNSLVRLCESFGISEEEMDDCVQYIKETLNVKI